jgi:aryl-alcohol dehydrogenase-like predicted oxidoreductase
MCRSFRPATSPRCSQSTLSDVAQRLAATPMQVALAWLLRRAPNILLIPGASSPAHLKENLAAAALHLPDGAVAALDGIAGSANRGTVIARPQAEAIQPHAEAWIASSLRSSQ